MKVVNYKFFTKFVVYEIFDSNIVLIYLPLFLYNLILKTRDSNIVAFHNNPFNYLLKQRIILTLSILTQLNYMFKNFMINFVIFYIQCQKVHTLMYLIMLSFNGVLFHISNLYVIMWRCFLFQFQPFNIKLKLVFPIIIGYGLCHMG